VPFVIDVMEVDLVDALVVFRVLHEDHFFVVEL